MKKWLKKRKLIILGLPVLVIVALVASFATATVNSSRINACNINAEAFLVEVNQVRASKGLQAVTYSDQLQEAARARILDMQKNDYYGHTNPQTKQQSYDFTAKFEPSATYLGEVLDDPQQASKAFKDFVNSPEHLAIIMNKKFNYIGVASAYNASDRPSYDNDGLPQGFNGAMNEQCTVVAEFANK